MEIYDEATSLVVFVLVLLVLVLVLVLLLLLLLLLTLQPWVGLGLFDNSIPHLSILSLHPPASNFHPP